MFALICFKVYMFQSNILENTMNAQPPRAPRLGVKQFSGFQDGKN